VASKAFFAANLSRPLLALSEPLALTFRSWSKGPENWSSSALEKTLECWTLIRQFGNKWKIGDRT